MDRRIATFLIVVAAASAGPAAAQTVQSRLVAEGFSRPVFATYAPGGAADSLYVVQQTGEIRLLNVATGGIGAEFVDLKAVTGAGLIAPGVNGGGSEQGLLGLAFHPDFQANGKLYVNYTTAGGAIRVDELTANAARTVVDPASRRAVIEIAHPNFTNHNGGWIGFDPTAVGSDPARTYLHIATGDGGGANDPGDNAQNIESLLGKILRIDVSTTTGYGVPDSNPFVDKPGRDEIFAYGLRNPYRASFDRQTGDLYIGDVGQNAREEINFISTDSNGGQNFGWDIREGTLGPPLPGSVDPIHEYSHSFGRSVTGGYVYRGPDADLSGTYIFGDFITRKVFSFRYDGTNAPEASDLTSQLAFQNSSGNPVTVAVSSFAESLNGNLFVLDYGGRVFEIVPVPEPLTTGLVVGLAGVWLVRRRVRKMTG